MTWDQTEKHALALGNLLRSEKASDDEIWLAQNQKALMTVVALRSAARASSFPLFGEADSVGKMKRKLNARGWVAAGLVAAGALLAGSWAMQDRKPSLTFTVKDAGSAVSGPQELGRVRAPQAEARTLEFSDGSKLQLAQGGSVRVREIDERGAEVVIENGRLHSSVMHLEDASWSVFAGPYEIQVIGTKFSTEWDPSTQRLVVLLNEGSVRVVGSDIEDHVALKPGQRFEAAPRQAWKVTAQSPPKADTEPEEMPEIGESNKAIPTLSEVTTTTDGKGASVAVRSGAVHPNAGPSWESLLRDGKNEEIVADAKKLGLSDCYSTCSVSRLRALADAARYKGEVTIAREALTHLRSRSPVESARSGYLLGSLSEARGQAASALTWYNTYLKEAPGGSFAAEARAGKMRALHALGHHSDAQSAANEYLRLYPRGTSATTARRILNKK